MGPLFGNSFTDLFTEQLFVSLNTVSHRALAYFGELPSLKVT